MTQNNKNSLKTNTYLATADSQIQPQPANDTLYQELELRYGGGFAQWVVDRLDDPKEPA